MSSWIGAKEPAWFHGVPAKAASLLAFSRPLCSPYDHYFIVKPSWGELRVTSVTSSFIESFGNNAFLLDRQRENTDLWELLACLFTVIWYQVLKAFEAFGLRQYAKRSYL